MFQGCTENPCVAATEPPQNRIEYSKAENETSQGRHSCRPRAAVWVIPFLLNIKPVMPVSRTKRIDDRMLFAVLTRYVKCDIFCLTKKHMMFSRRTLNRLRFHYSGGIHLSEKTGLSEVGVSKDDILFAAGSNHSLDGPDITAVDLKQFDRVRGQLCRRLLCLRRAALHRKRKGAACAGNDRRREPHPV